MPYLDFICPQCGLSRTNQHYSGTPFVLCGCGTEMEVLWTASHATTAMVAPGERTIVWENPATGEVRYPARNDVPLPQRYAAAGFERRELNSLRDLEKFEREKGVRNEAAWFDRGSGRGFDTAFEPGRVDPTEFAERIKRLR